MKESSRNFLSEFLSRRASFIEVLLTALFLALGINLVSGSLPSLLQWSERQTLIVGICVSLLSIIYFAIRFFIERHRTQIYSGFLSYNRRNNEIINVPEYYFSRIIKMYIDFVLELLPNSKKGWIDKSLENALIDDDRESIKIVREAVEYFVLKELSYHLQNYFNELGETHIRSFYRSDMKSVSDSNRFIKLFSAPRINTPEEDDELQGEFPDVTRIHKQRSTFVLKLPEESKVIRKDERKIEIDTNKFKLVIEAVFIGVNSEIPVGFHKYYLKLNRNDRVTNFTIGVKVEVLFKLRMFFSRSGLKYYRWIDSFLDKLNESISESMFFNAIQWKAAYPVIEHVNSVAASLRSPSDDKDSSSEG
jgi:hypothetical protein